MRKTHTDLWAKSRRGDGPDPPTVFEHCEHVHGAAEALWETLETPLADATLIETQTLRSRIRSQFLVSAMLHDVMKANSAFQEMLSGILQKRHQHQPVRHEVLAAVLLLDDRFWGQWFAKSLGETERWMVAWAVAGHHLQMRRRRDGELGDPLFRTTDVPRSITAYLRHEDVSRVLATVCDLLHLDPAEAPRCSDSSFDVLDDGDDGLERSIRRFVRQSDRLWRRWQRNDEMKRELALLKALLIVADVAGSALPLEYSTPEKRVRWIVERLDRTLDPSELKRVYEKNLDGRAVHGFQEKVAASRYPVTVVTAGCGNGKTTAGYMWGEHWADGRKLFFTYPTTGTASAGFKDYLLLQPELHRTLIHGRAEVDLASMPKSAEDRPPIEQAQRLESLNAWGQQAVACTADTVLGLIQNQRRPLFAFPAIIRGAFVFDEVHSYDKRMFAQLLRFLKTFPGVPALIMSASIPPKRLEALRLALGERMNPEPIRGEHTLERIKRYKLHERSEDDCWQGVESLLSMNNGHNANKVLWVCNTVNTAIAVFRHAKERFHDVNLLLYHSRYRYMDRVCLQQQVVEEFRYEDDAKRQRRYDRPAMAITTQVCEMSLDISADLLVTACCPLPSLVQRLGRLNRYAAQDDPWPAFVHEFSGRPYHEEDAPQHVEKAMQMVRELEGDGCDQLMLAKYIDELQSTEELPEYSAWLDGGWQSEPLPAREGDNSITVVRAEDLPKPSRACKPNDLIPLTIPMLFKRGFTWSERAGGYPVAEAEHGVDYNWNDDTQSGEGASWRKAN